MAAALAARARRRDFFLDAWSRANLTLIGPRDDCNHFFLQCMFGNWLLCFILSYKSRDDKISILC